MATNTGVLGAVKPAAATETTLFKNDVFSSATGTVIVNCDNSGADTYNISLRQWDQALTLDATTYKLHRGDIISNVKWSLSAAIPLADAIPGTKFTSTDGEKCAYLLDVVDPAITTYLVRYESLIAFTLENVADNASSPSPDYANGETVSNGGGVTGTVYEFVPGVDNDGVLWVGNVAGGTFAEGDVLTGGSSTTSGTVSVGGIATAVSRFVFNDGASGTVYRLQNQIQPELLTDRVYRFDVSHTSMTGIDLRFSEFAGGTNTGQTEYTTGKTTSGTAGSANAYVQYDLSGAELVTQWYPFDFADANYDDDSQWFVFSEEYTFNEVWVYTQVDEGLKDVSGWVITDSFTYRDVTYAVDAIAGDSYGTVLDWDDATGIAYVTNGPGSALWVGTDTFLDSPRQTATSKATATISSVSNTDAADVIINADAIAQSASEERKGIIIGPGQSIKVEATNGRVNFVLDAFQDTVSELTTSLYQRTTDYQTAVADTAGGAGDDAP